jgi:hypothetical protein
MCKSTVRIPVTSLSGTATCSSRSPALTSSEKSLSTDTRLPNLEATLLQKSQGLIEIFLVKFCSGTSKWSFSSKHLQSLDEQGCYPVFKSLRRHTGPVCLGSKSDSNKLASWLCVFQSFHFLELWPKVSKCPLSGSRNPRVPVEEATQMHCLNLFDALLSRVK